MRVSISCGDINGISLQLLLHSHKKIMQKCRPLYCIDKEILQEAAELLGVKLPQNLQTCSPKEILSSIPRDYESIPLETLSIPKITPAQITKESGLYSYASFLSAFYLAKLQKTKALVTLPIHKKAWQLAGVKYAGHTEAMRSLENKPLIMVLGNPKLFVALFSDHIPLREVPQKITQESLQAFLLNLAPHVRKPCGVLGLNPHAGDHGVLGSEDGIISKAIAEVNLLLKKEVFVGALVPDTAFIGQKYRYMVAMYHDQGLIPLKTLFFDKSINVTFGLPFIRTSPDHGVAFDKAYEKGSKISFKSYECAVKYAIKYH